MTTEEATKKDFFISYATEDELWAEWIGWQLELEGFSTFFQAWDFLAGQSISALIDYATAHAERTIAVLSPDYLKSSFGAAEWGAAFRGDPDGRKQKLLPVMVRTVKLPPLMSNGAYISFIDQSEARARDLLVGAAKNQRRKPTTQPRFPGSKKSAPMYPTELQGNATATPSPQRIHDLRTLLQSSGLVSRSHDWLVADQLDSGGFGKSQRNLMRAMAKPELTETEFLEGGIFSTYAAVMAHKAYSDRMEFLNSPLARTAMSYLVRHQGHAGGFGRFVQSRSGLQIHQNMRHTAFAVTALHHMEGSPASIKSGVNYLEKRLPTTNWEDESSASTAPAALLGLHELGLMRLSTRWVQRLTEEIVSRAGGTSHAPLWAPYAEYPEMVFDTALSTIMLLPHPTPRPLLTTVLRAISYVAGHVGDLGVPYHPGLQLGDVGMTAFLLSSIVDRVLEEPEATPAMRDHFIELCYILADSLEAMWDEQEYWAHSYTSTVQGLLLAGGSRA